MGYSDKVLEAILEELKNIHFHINRLDAFYKMAHNIKEDKTGAWIEDSPQDKRKGTKG